MSSITHHIPDELLIAYASGSLEQVFSELMDEHVNRAQGREEVAA